MKGSVVSYYAVFLGGVKIHLTQKKMTINYLNVFFEKVERTHVKDENNAFFH